MAVCTLPGCPELVRRGYCARHSRTIPRNHHGILRQARGHGADYDRARAALLGLPCHWCGKPADTADYRIPVSQGGTLADLVPACSSCNYARGAALMHRVGGSQSSERSPQQGPHGSRENDRSGSELLAGPLL